MGFWTRKPDPAVQEQTKRAEDAIQQSLAEQEKVNAVREFVGNALDYLAQLNEENSFSIKMEAAYAPRKIKGIR